MITERFNEPDNLEIIRDQIAGIIALEMDEQYAMASDDSDPVAEDYFTRVLVENDEPLFAGGDNGDIFPLVNVCVDNRVLADGTSAVNSDKAKATLFLDCYQIGNNSGRFAGRKATIKAWKLARCVRRILRSDYYKYLRLRGIVSDVKIVEMRAGVPAMNDSSIKVVLVRITLEVTYDEKAPVINGETLELIPVQISDDNGQVVVDIK